MNPMLQNALPAVLLLAVMVGIALALKWARGRLPGLPASGAAAKGPSMQLLGSLSLGPQQRLVTVQVDRRTDPHLPGAGRGCRQHHPAAQPAHAGRRSRRLRCHVASPGRLRCTAGPAHRPQGPPCSAVTPSPCTGVRALALLLALMLLSLGAWAQVAPVPTPQGPSLPLMVGQGAGGTSYSVPIQTLLFFTALSFLPAVLLMMTGFTRIVIVLSLLRQALGTQSAPPNQVIDRPVAVPHAVRHGADAGQASTPMPMAPIRATRSASSKRWNAVRCRCATSCSSRRASPTSNSSPAWPNCRPK